MTRCMIVITILLSSLASPAWAESSWSELEQRCWNSYQAKRTSLSYELSLSEVRFANLWDGQRVLSPFKVAFAVRGMGVTPAKVPVKNTGHHHLLVNQDLPANVREDLPFNDNHRHFGKGQTSTVLDLPPGKHRLRLLFADADHVPFFVYSRQITVEVLARRSDAKAAQLPRVIPDDFVKSCALWYENLVTRPDPQGKPAYFLNLREGDELSSPFRLMMGVEGYGVCSADAKVENTGHFALDLLQNGRPVQKWVLRGGQTEMDATLAPGKYTLNLQLRASDGRPLGIAETVSFTVKK
jgi:hypothetical protein